MRKAVLLINLGTPDSPKRGDVARYLREFLMDGRVIDIPAIPRNLLVKLLVFDTPFFLFVLKHLVKKDFDNA